MIVDFHSHNFPPSVATRALSLLTKKTSNRLFPVGDGTLVNQLDYLEQAGIDKAVMCPIATRPEHFDVILATALAIREGRLGERARQRIIPFVSIHPLDPQLNDHLEQIAALGIKGLKVHPYYQDFDLADPSVWPMFRKIADLGLVVQCHCGYDIGYPGRYDFCGPREIVKLLKNVRGLKFVAAHLGGCSGFAPHMTDELIECGAYIDTAALHIDQHRDEQMRILRSWPRDRILFGSDFPWVHYPEILAWVRSIRAKEDLPLLLGGNAMALLG